MTHLEQDEFITYLQSSFPDWSSTDTQKKQWKGWIQRYEIKESLAAVDTLAKYTRFNSPKWLELLKYLPKTEKQERESKPLSDPSCWLVCTGKGFTVLPGTFFECDEYRMQEVKDMLVAQYGGEWMPYYRKDGWTKHGILATRNKLRSAWKDGNNGVLC